jgi:hypothetical protein
MLPRKSITPSWRSTRKPSSTSCIKGTWKNSRLSIQLLKKKVNAPGLRRKIMPPQAAVMNILKDLRIGELALDF